LAGLSPPSDPLVSRLAQHVDMLAGVIGPRPPTKPAALHAASGYLERELAAAGDVVTREEYLALKIPVWNLVVERKGTTRPDEVVIVAAHYDSLECTPGADDNASACAMLIEVARALAGRTFQRTLRFIALTCEEPPYFNLGSMGSQIHARGCRQRRENIHAMLSLEMVGYYKDAVGSQAIPPGIPKGLRWLFPKRANFLAAVANPKSAGLLWPFRLGFKRGSRLPLFTIALPESIHEIRRSDNSSFWDQGYRALMITDTSFLRNPHYHQATDTPDTLDYERMAQATRGVTTAVARLAKG
jgi:Zn-dependent M28 family amino/carboxypeptidase